MGYVRGIRNATNHFNGRISKVNEFGEDFAILAGSIKFSSIP